MTERDSMRRETRQGKATRLDSAERFSIKKTENKHSKLIERHMSKHCWKCVLKYTEIHTYAHVKYLCVCVSGLASPVAGLDFTSLLSVIGLHYNRLYWHFWTLVSPLSLSLSLFTLLPFSLSLLYTYLVSESIDAICPCSIHLSATQVVEFELKKKRREVINLFNASLIELTLAGSSEQRFQSNHQRFLYTPFSNPFPCVVAVKLPFYRFHCA